MRTARSVLQMRSQDSKIERTKNCFSENHPKRWKWRARFLNRDNTKAMIRKHIGLWGQLCREETKSNLDELIGIADRALIASFGTWDFGD